MTGSPYAQTLLSRRAGLAVLAGGLVAVAGPVLAQSSFSGFVEGFRARARARGVSDQAYDRAMGGLTADDEVLQLQRRQAEFMEAPWQYLSRRVSDWRITTGRARAQEHSALLARIEADYGVDRFAIMSVWGNESSYGEVLTNNRVMRNVFRSLATLSWGEPRRKAYWEGELLNALIIVERGWADPREMVGSWAGAMGHTQFMPEAWLRMAVDYDGDGRANLFRIPDALASTARFLRDRGRWQTGRPWGYEVVAASGFEASAADGSTARSLSRWASMGIARADGMALSGDSEARLRFPSGLQGPGFLTMQNFRAFLAYNPSFLYALAVAHLGDRIRGGGPFVTPWPGAERVLTSDEMAEIQRRLTAAGFDTGGTDGRVGDMTRRAVRGFQERNNLPLTDGFPSEPFLNQIRQITPEPQRNFFETLFGGGR